MNHPPRVLIVSERFYPIVGGAEKQSLTMFNFLENQCSISVLTRRFEPSLPPSETINAVPIHRIGLPGHTAKAHFLSLPFFFLTTLNSLKRYDVVHALDSGNICACVTLAALIWKRPVISKIPTLGDAFVVGGRPTLLGNLRKWALSQVSVHIALSKEIQNQLVDGGVRQTRILQIGNGVDTSWFRAPLKEERDAVRDKLNIPESTVVVTFTGRLVHRKNILLLLRLLNNKFRNCKIRVLIAGSGKGQEDSCESELIEYSRAQSLENMVEFLGEVDDIRSILWASDIFFFPSVREGLPNAVLEAMSTGLCVCASKIPGNVDILGWSPEQLFESNDEESAERVMAALVKDQSTRHQLGRKNRAFIEESYSMKKISELYLDLYTRLSRHRH